MPVQSLTEWTGGAVALPVHHGTYLARLFVFGMTGIITALGTYGMYQVISPVNVTWLQAIFAALFALTFTWISFACASAILGFFLLLTGWHLTPKLTDAGQMGRNALLMPIYNEDPARVFATLERMARNLQAAGAAAHFDMFILSDTRTAEAAAREEEEFASLRARAGGILPIYYRRRSQNHHRKAGNI
ncbi:MAG TPA: glucan biosynthesis glucosyltransferase H, partial [Aestuariivirga sp.]|nr:glucan biosynthesis glucosyltransferase H [Aestuariivirga sp.]